MAHNRDLYAGLQGAKSLHANLKEFLLEGRWGTLLLFDLDAFQQINVRQGHPVGDRVIALTEAYIRAQNWHGYRIGGDQFGLVLSAADGPLDGAALRTGLRRAIHAELGLTVTISGGGLRHPGDQFHLDAGVDQLLFATAHRLQVKAKQQGRDRIVWLPLDDAAPEAMAEQLFFYRELARFNSALAHKRERESRTDFLTGLYNRRGFEDIFARRVEAARRTGAPVALLYMDSDSLKKINDAGGHDAGDRFILDIATILNEVVRGTDFIARWGADEFAVVSDQPTPNQARVLAERIRQAIARRTDGTLSVGVYCGVPENVEVAVKAADEALYRAKGEGKNRVEVVVD